MANGQTAAMLEWLSATTEKSSTTENQPRQNSHDKNSHDGNSTTKQPRQKQHDRDSRSHALKQSQHQKAAINGRFSVRVFHDSAFCPAVL
jgi:hypothetical protein